MGFSVVGTVIGGVAGLCAFAASWITHKRHQQLKAIPSAEIATASFGLVELSGQVIANETIVSPLTHSRCVLYRFIVRKRLKTGSKTHLATILNVTDSRPFWVQDSSGIAVVDPRGAEFSSPSRRVFVPKPATTVEQLKSFIDSFDRDDIDIPEGIANLLMEKDMYDSKDTWIFTEFVIFPRSMVYVMGNASPHPQDPQSTLVQKGDHNDIFLISDISDKRQAKIYMWASLLSSLLAAVLIIGTIVRIFL